MKKNKRVTEEIGRNYKTIDPTPIDFFHDERVSVEIFPAYNQQFAASIEASSIGLKTPLRTFNTEEEANTWARNVYTDFVSKLNSLEESVYLRILNSTTVIK